MAENTKIEWATHTFNPWMGCTKVSEACRHCYAERDMDHRYGKGAWGPGGTRVVTSEANWRKPLKWNREAAESGERPRVFCASLADVFEDWPGPMLDSSDSRIEHDEGSYSHAFGDRFVRMGDVRRRLFELIDATPYLDWLLLTKRPSNVKRMGFGDVATCFYCRRPNPNLVSPGAANWRCECGEIVNRWHRPNVWLGTSVENQAAADARIPHLLGCRDLASVLFLSMEPLLGSVDLTRVGPERWDVLSGWKAEAANERGWANTSMIDWVIAGGESGPEARPSHPDWFRSIRDQCEAAGVPFHFPQWGEWQNGSGRGVNAVVLDNGRVVCPDTREGRRDLDLELNGRWYDFAPSVMARVGKKAAGRLLDGVQHDGVPRCVAAAG